jgi:hypothetical protein
MTTPELQTLQKTTAPRREQCSNIVVARSKILGFHPEDSHRSQNNASTKVIARHNQLRPNLGFSPSKVGLCTSHERPDQLKLATALAAPFLAAETAIALHNTGFPYALRYMGKKSDCYSKLLHLTFFQKKENFQSYIARKRGKTIYQT